jgi:hypothetical protein
MRLLIAGACCIATLCIGILAGVAVAEPETVVQTKTETVTQVETVEVTNEDACDMLFAWYMNWPGKAFSTETDLMYSEYLGVCGG